LVRGRQWHRPDDRTRAGAHARQWGGGAGSAGLGRGAVSAVRILSVPASAAGEGAGVRGFRCRECGVVEADQQLSARTTYSALRPYSPFTCSGLWARSDHGKVSALARLSMGSELRCSKSFSWWPHCGRWLCALPVRTRLAWRLSQPTFYFPKERSSLERTCISWTTSARTCCVWWAAGRKSFGISLDVVPMAWWRS